MENDRENNRLTATKEKYSFLWWSILLFFFLPTLYFRWKQVLNIKRLTHPHQITTTPRNSRDSFPCFHRMNSPLGQKEKKSNEEPQKRKIFSPAHYSQEAEIQRKCEIFALPALVGVLRATALDNRARTPDTQWSLRQNANQYSRGHKNVFARI